MERIPEDASLQDWLDGEGMSDTQRALDILLGLPRHRWDEVGPVIREWLAAREELVMTRAQLVSATERIDRVLAAEDLPEVTPESLERRSILGG